MALIDNLRRLGEQVQKRLPNTKGEEATKTALILPFLGALGYDIFDPSEVQPEYVADFAKKRSGGQAEKVDYAICLSGAPVMFFECKAADATPQQHGGQLARYFNATPSVKVAVVTNGTRYLFFTDLEEQNIMSERPFFEFNVLSFTERDVETLEAFSRSQFDAATVRTRAEDIIFTSKVTAHVNELLRNPSESFTRYLLGELDITTGKLTAKRVEKFVPIVRKAIQSTLLDMATRSIRGETEEMAPIVAAPPAPAPAEPAQDTVGRGIVTTPEELEAFEIVKRICGDSTSPTKHQVGYKDSINYFGINLGGPKKWFVRLCFDAKRKFIATRVPLDRAAPLVPGMEIEAAPEGLGKTRVYIGSLKDLERLRPLIMVAYEDEIRRADGGDEADEVPAGAPLTH